MVFDIFKKIMSRICPSAPLKLIDEYGVLMQMSPRERVYAASLLDSKSFLEIGSGYSTLWFSQFARRIVSVETRKKWYENILKLINQNNVTNVELLLFPPEPCAYDENGQETWNNRNNAQGSDYGTEEEFSGYLLGIERLLTNADFDVVLVDGNVRELVIKLLRDRKFQGVILLHDVLPERDYLNKTILTMEGMKLVRQVESLVEFATCPNQCSKGS